MKTCNRCRTTKPLSEFHKSKSHRDGLSVWCKSCKAEYRAAYREQNREKEIAKAAEYRATRKDETSIRNAVYYRDNRDRIREQKRGYSVEYYSINKDRIKSRVSAYREANKPAHNLRVRNRKNHIKVIDELNPSEWKAMVDACGNTCIVPGCGISPVTMDHVIPRTKGGRHRMSNLQPLCSHHNDSKGTKTTDYRGAF